MGGLYKKILFSGFLFLVILVFWGITKPVFAQPTPIPTCSPTRNNEFHSLRPYKFQPCDPYPSDLTAYCGNSIVLYSQESIIYNIRDYIPVPYCNPNSRIPDCDCGGALQDACCTQNYDANGNPNGMITCSYIREGTRTISLTFENAELPIMGNTENVNNRNNPYPADEGEFTHEAKVNEYVSWYLNGITGRAEYPYPDTTNPDDISKTVNLSGPIKKLLPYTIQNKERIQQIDDVAPNTIRHNQTVACTYPGLQEVCLPFIGCHNFPNLSIPVECYRGFPHIFDNFKKLAEWNPHKPPLEEDYLGQPHSEFLKAYYNWRGLICLPITINLPVFGTHTFFFCLDNPFSPNFWSMLFPYIPFSSTEDRVGNVSIRNLWVDLASKDFEIIDLRVNSTDAKLYFPHMEEDNQLAELLQNTYVSKGGELTGDPSGVFRPSDPYCDLEMVRTNPGDPISNPDDPSELSASVYYKARVNCDFYQGEGDFNGLYCESPTSADPPGVGGKCQSLNVNNPMLCGTYYNSLDCGYGYNTCALNCQPVSEPSIQGCSDWGRSMGYITNCMPAVWGCTFLDDLYEPPFGPCNNYPNVKCAITNTCSPNPPNDSSPTQQCTKRINVNIKTETKTPLIEEIWSRLVAGPSGVFKRIFPKVTTGGAVEAIWDIPGATEFSYTCTDTGGGCSVGNPGSGRSTPELYFPHVGGISEYFLKGIQTALRPKGYGSEILSRSGSQIPGQPGSCNYTEADISSAIDAAASKYGIRSSMLRAIFEIEAYEFIADPLNYTCEENFAEAAGLTQVTRGTYQDVTCPNERYDNGSDIGICTSDGNRLSRCDVNDAFELAARVLLSKIGLWNGASCSPYGNFPSNDWLATYNAACRYYGKFDPDYLTNQYSYNLPSGQCSPQNYCDIVLNKMRYGSCDYP
jgi:hypothetical protein